MAMKDLSWEAWKDQADDVSRRLKLWISGDADHDDGDDEEDIIWLLVAAVCGAQLKLEPLQLAN